MPIGAGDSGPQDIDALFQVGGLRRGRHQRTSPTVSAKASRRGGSGRASGPGVESARDRSVRSGPDRLLKLRKASLGSEPVMIRIPEWSQYPWLIHGFSTRLGGVSKAYSPGARKGELNLGRTASDSAQNVLKNRRIFLRALMARTGSAGGRSGLPPLMLLRQVHSGLVRLCQPADAKLCAASGKVPAGDGWIATDPNVLLAIQTADCVPILVVDVRQRVVAAFHAGWRGTLARIVERGVGRMRAEFGCRPEDLTAAVGPGIGSCCYAVGQEVRTEFESQFVYADALFHEVFDSDPIRRRYPLLFLTARPPGHSDLGPSLHLDLIEANRRQLLDAGVEAEKIHLVDLCTACHPDIFFSYRAEEGRTGRMLSAIGTRANRR